MATGGTCALIVILSCALAVSPFASFTATVKVLAPVPVGVPLMAPELLFKLSPAGKDPEAIDQVYGVVPPVAASWVAGYATPMVPAGSEVVVMERGGTCAFMVMLNGAFAVSPFASFTITVKALVPVAVGVPPIAPELAVKLSPAGKAPA